MDATRQIVLLSACEVAYIGVGCLRLVALLLARVDQLPVLSRLEGHFAE